MCLTAQDDGGVAYQFAKGMRFKCWEQVESMNGLFWDRPIGRHPSDAEKKDCTDAYSHVGITEDGVGPRGYVGRVWVGHKEQCIVSYSLRSGWRCDSPQQ